ncbi:MAG TPA: sigma 54-interacting transcriptional regulator, partial [Thermodesulfobacteriota bacterium]|nr:sigma 54-interacting transcriptional regulator [Thermodesulfobacteriota bacterium]
DVRSLPPRAGAYIVDKVKGFAAGGLDYITKPFQDEELLARVETHLSLRRLQNQVEVQNQQLQEEISKARRAEEALQKANDELENRVKERTAALQESEARLSLAAASGEIGLWSMNLRDGKIWGTEKAWALFGVPAEGLGEEGFYQMVHPEDREMLHEKIDEAVQSGKDSNFEYRFVMPDGSVRWRVSHARPNFTPAGEADRLMGATVDSTERKRMEEALETRLREIEELKRNLEQENVYLREEVSLQHLHEEIVGQSESMKKVLLQVEQVSGTDSTVLIQGETGTGKELVARAIHRLSGRKDRPLITVNCASLPPTLIESELFGREKGAYTGALTRMIGRFEAADGATIFLDEIGEVPPEIQSKLLRILEEGQFERLGAAKTYHVNVRVIAATNRDLNQEVNAGRFRSDLFYRLNVFPITIPPLRERREDIPIMAWAFVRQFEKRMGKRIDAIPRKKMEALRRYSWPGNARELRNVIEHAMIVSSSRILLVDPPKIAHAVAHAETARSGHLEEIERGYILSVLEKSGWRITGRWGAAEALGLKRTTLQSRMKKLGITRPER